MSMLSILATSFITYLATTLFISVILYTRAYIQSFILITTLWTLAILPLILVTSGDITLMLKLIGQPANYFDIYNSNNKKPTKMQIKMGQNFIFVAIFALIFSIYIPLDSDTILQVWPIAPTIGSVAGFVVGSLVDFFL